MSGGGEDDNVGYGRPPRKHQFEPGRSGNPRGRPRKKKPPAPLAFDYNALATIQVIRQAGAQLVAIKDHRGRTTRVPLIEAAVKRLALDAAQGRRGAQNQFIRISVAADEHDLRDRQSRFRQATAYIAQCNQDTGLARALKLAAPLTLPHPADFDLDFQAGTVVLRGPHREAGFKDYQEGTERCELLLQAIALIAAEYGSTDEPPMLQEWLRLQADFDMINDVLPVSLQRFLPNRSFHPDASRPGDRSATEHHRRGAIAAAAAERG